MIETEARPALLEIDLASEHGLALLHSVAARHGQSIVRAAELAGPLFMLRSPWAPGLRFVGGHTKPQAQVAQQTFSLSGAGETLEDAFASCIGEGVDRLAQIERPGDVSACASLLQVRHRVMPSALSLIDRQLDVAGLSASTALEWVNGEIVAPVNGSVAGCNVLLPADWCLRRAEGGTRLRSSTVLSAGVAAGPDYDWAASRALLELIERDAASLWWIGGRRGRPVALDEPSMPNIARLLRSLRQHATERRTWLLDITTDVEIPAVAALSCSANGREVASGLSARRSFGEAACAAILELCQMELAIQLAACKLIETGEKSLTSVDRMHLKRASELDAERCELLHPLGSPATRGAVAGQSGLSAVANVLIGAGIEAALVTLTRPHHGIQVVRAIAPALQPMPSEILTARLQKVSMETGGGTRFTGGIALM